MPNSTHLSALTKLNKEGFTLFIGGSHLRLPWRLNDKESAYQCKRHTDSGSMPGSGRSPGEGNGSPLSILAWKMPWTEEHGGGGGATVHRVAQSLTQLSHSMQAGTVETNTKL